MRWCSAPYCFLRCPGKRRRVPVLARDLPDELGEFRREATRLPTEDHLQRLALALVGSFVHEHPHNYLCLPIPHIALEFSHRDKVQAVQLDISVVSLANVPGEHPLAPVIGRACANSQGQGMSHLQTSNQSPSVRQWGMSPAAPDSIILLPFPLTLRKDVCNCILASVLLLHCRHSVQCFQERPQAESWRTHFAPGLSAPPACNCKTNATSISGCSPP
jgi:hypothetical protein